MGSSDGPWDTQLSRLVEGFHVLSMKAAYPRSRMVKFRWNYDEDSSNVYDRNINTKIVNCR